MNKITNIIALFSVISLYCLSDVQSKHLTSVFSILFYKTIVHNWNMKRLVFNILSFSLSGMFNRQPWVGNLCMVDIKRIGTSLVILVSNVSIIVTYLAILVTITNL